MHTLPAPQGPIIGTFLVLLAAALAISPLGLLFKSLAILLTLYLAFAVGGMPFAYLVALVAPPVGLLSGDSSWLIMLPFTMSSLLLAALGLEYAWRYPAIVVSPLLYVLPQLIAHQLAQKELFAVSLPWEPARNWLLLHGLMGLAGALLAVYWDRWREKQLGPARR